uniref:Uncharacterized protein n=1 Tax=Anguilla anguilla TaxID=7936 RepID=A0A0E9VSB6_ANGAN
MVRASCVTRCGTPFVPMMSFLPCRAYIWLPLL